VRSDRLIDLSVIIVNYNVREFTEQCLRSLFADLDDRPFEIFVVDNASTDGSVEYLRSSFPQITLIANEVNVGFGAANNQALKRSNGKYLLVLNPDTIVQKNSLKALIQVLEQNPKVGAVGPKLVDQNGRFDKTSKRGLPTPWVAFSRLSGLARLFPKSKIFGKYDLLYLDPDITHEVDVLQGACMMVRCEVYDQIGGFDEAFFMYGEDIDWCHRILQAGWKIIYSPTAIITHFRGESTRRSSIDRDKAFYGAMRIYAHKHFTGRYSILTLTMVDLGITFALLMARIRSKLTSSSRKPIISNDA